MATLTIRNLPDDVHQGLRARAAANGRSMEAEARVALTKSVNDNAALEEAPARPKANWPDIQARARKIMMAANGGVMPENVVDEWIAEKRLIAAREHADYDRMAGVDVKK
jgi:plasmid stability protein